MEKMRRYPVGIQTFPEIVEGGYAIPYSTKGKKVVKVGVSFSMESKTIEDWVIV